jgi:predicted dehydrogenase
MGRRHVQVVKELGLSLVGVADSFPDALQQAAREHQLSLDQLFASTSELLARKPDCVIVATTAPGHADCACLAAEAGARFILCEKPLAVSLAECDRVLRTCRKNGTRLAVNHQMRFMEQYTEPKRLLASPDFGGLCSVTVTAGNFGLAMNGTHYFEMFRYLCDEDPREVSAWFSAEMVPNPRGPQFQDRAGCVRISTASGKRFFMDCSADQGHGMFVTYAGRHGRLTVDELTGDMRWAFRKEEHRALPTTRYGMPFEEGHKKITPADSVAPTRAVLDALLHERDYPTGEQGRLAVAVLVAAHLSNERGHVPVVLVESDEYADRVFPWA